MLCIMSGHVSLSYCPRRDLIIAVSHSHLHLFLMGVLIELSCTRHRADLVVNHRIFLLSRTRVGSDVASL